MHVELLQHQFINEPKEASHIISVEAVILKPDSTCSFALPLDLDDTRMIPTFSGPTAKVSKSFCVSLFLQDTLFSTNASIFGKISCRTRNANYINRS